MDEDETPMHTGNEITI